MRNHCTFSAFLAASFLATALFGGLRAGEVISDPGFALENGDTNGDLERDLSDPVYLLGYLFLGGPAPVELRPCATMPASVQNGDTNGDGTRDVSDAIYLFGWLFTGGPEPINACDQRGVGGAKAECGNNICENGENAAKCPCDCAVPPTSCDEDPVVNPGTLFKSDGFTCEDGATDINGPSFGTVNFNQPRDDSHTHANVQLRGATAGVYDIFGNHDKVCLANKPEPNHNGFTFPVFDFPLRPGHATTVTVGANGKGKARIGLTYRTQTPFKTQTIFVDGELVIVDGFDFDDTDISKMHKPGVHLLWLTLVGTSGEAKAKGVVLRSTAVEVVIPDHEGHTGG